MKLFRVVDVCFGAALAEDGADRLAFLDVAERGRRGVHVHDVNAVRSQARMGDRLSHAFGLAHRVGKHVVARIAVDAVPRDLAIDLRSPRKGVLQPLQRVEASPPRTPRCRSSPVSKGREALAGTSFVARAPCDLNPAKMPKVWMLSLTPPADREVDLPEAEHLGGVDDAQVAGGAGRSDRVGRPVTPRLSDASPAGLLATVRGLW